MFPLFINLTSFCTIIHGYIQVILEVLPSIWPVSVDTQQPIIITLHHFPYLKLLRSSYYLPLTDNPNKKIENSLLALPIIPTPEFTKALFASLKKLSRRKWKENAKNKFNKFEAIFLTLPSLFPRPKPTPNKILLLICNCLPWNWRAHNLNWIPIPFLYKNPPKMWAQKFQKPISEELNKP